MSPTLSEKTLGNQRKLAEYCRNGEPVQMDGLTPNRIHHYRRLVFGVVSEALSSTYPLTQNLLTEKEWKTLINQFFEEHKCKDPQVWKMPKELISFVHSTQQDLLKSYPQIIDLLNLEWIEVKYYMMPDFDTPRSTTKDFWQDAWQLNPESEVLFFNYPVHRKNARLISRTDRGSYHCLVFRQPETLKVKFMHLSPIFAMIIELMRTEGESLASHYPKFTAQLNLSMTQNEFSSLIKPFFIKLKQDGMIY
ncbi:MAG: putative DNA-binding domain-containing protein [Salibacteraceae bacterium]